MASYEFSWIRRTWIGQSFVNITLSPRLRMFHKVRCSKWLLARCVGREIIVPHIISNTIWAFPLEKNAFRNQLGPRSIPTTDTWTYRGPVWCEVIADDFVVIGFGHTHLEAIHDHDKNPMTFLMRCEVQGVGLTQTSSLFGKRRCHSLGT